MPTYLPLALVLLSAGLLVVGGTVYLMARGLVRPPRMTDGKAVYLLGRLTPPDVGLATFAERPFMVRDERAGRPVRLAAWWVPAAIASPRTVVVVHGYADAKVGALAWGPVWHGLGFNVLLVDLRAHGESDGAVCSAGFWERRDLAQVVNQLQAAEPAAAGEVILFGASLGAAVVAATAEVMAEAGGPPRAVVLDSPFADFRSAALAHFGRLGLPGGRLATAAVRVAERLAAADFAAVRPVDVVGRAGCPVLVLAAANDAYVTPAESAALEAAVTSSTSAGRGVYRRFDGVDHLMAVVAEPAGYRAAIEEFLRNG